MKKTLPKAPSKRLREDVAPALLRRIINGSLKPGEKVKESRLSRDLGVSRTPLREALLSLEREGLIRSDLRRGFTIEPLSAREVREIYPVLAALECLAIRSCFDLLPLLVPQLVKINAAFARSRSPANAQDLDTRWHETLMSQSKNSRLASLLGMLRQSIRRYEHLYMSDLKLIPMSVRQHNAIIDAIQKEDLEALLNGVERNYRFGMQILLRKMGEE